MFEKITHIIIDNLQIKPKLIVLDGSEFTSDNADKYYSKIRNKEQKHYTKSHIIIDVDSKIILHSQAVKGPRHDTIFAIASLRAVKKYKVEQVLADKAYDTKNQKMCKQRTKSTRSNTTQIQLHTRNILKTTEEEM